MPGNRSYPPREHRITVNKSILHTHRRLWLLIIQIALGIAALYGIIHFARVDFADLKFGFENLSWKWMLLGVFFFFVSMIIIAVRYKILIKEPAISITYWFGLSLFLNALLTFIPFRVGEVSFPLLLAQDHKIEYRTSISVLVFVRILDLFIVGLAGLLGIHYLRLAINWQTIIGKWPLLIIAIAILVIVLWIVRKNHNFRAKVDNELRRWLNNFADLLLNFRTVLFTVIFSAAYFIAISLQSFCIFNALGLNIPFYHILILSVVTIFASLIPIHPPGGWGTIDSIQLLILTGLGYTLQVSSTILSAHLIYSLLIISGGLLGWILRNHFRQAIGLENEKKQPQPTNN